MGKKYNVTESIAPEREDFIPQAEEILERRQFTNNGPVCQRLEQKLAELIGTPNIALCANGTLGLEIAIHAAGLAGSTVITTPFTYVATVSALLWTGCKVIFADIDEESLCISPASVKERMTQDVRGLMPVNVYGHPCDDPAIEKIALENSPACRVIYDAAQAFGASLNGRPLLRHGDFAVCSFHATKVFHTFEGGAVVSRTEEGLQKLRLLRAFGHINDEHYCAGINAKMSEIHAAMGIAQLKNFEKHRQLRKRLTEIYNELLAGADLRFPRTPAGFHSNYSYYPVIFNTERALLAACDALMEQDIIPRRYFYPSLTKLPYLPGQSCPVAESVAPRVMCLPLHSGLPLEIVEITAAIVRKNC